MAVITTARRADSNRQQEAESIAARWGIPCIPRHNHNLQALLSAYGQVLVLDSTGLSCHTTAGRLFFHPNMAALRLKEVRAGKEDKMLAAMALARGDSLLDCTAGLCSDSLVAAWRVGKEGRVTALEESLLIYLVVGYGLSRCRRVKRFSNLAQKIDLRLANFRDYLAAQPDNSYDVVYFDPMFSVPVHRASAMEPLRPLATYSCLEARDIIQARRVARRRVVVKERSFYPFARLGLEQVVGSKQRRVAYGVLTAETKE